MELEVHGRVATKEHGEGVADAVGARWKASASSVGHREHRRCSREGVPGGAVLPADTSTGAWRRLCLGQEFSKLPVYACVWLGPRVLHFFFQSWASSQGFPFLALATQSFCDSLASLKCFVFDFLLRVMETAWWGILGSNKMVQPHSI